MKICIINGSPKGNYSITLQTLLYLQKHFPDEDYEILNVGQKIKRYEKELSEAIAAIQRADLLIFSYPVYTFIAPYQLHRFLELLKAQNLCLSGKYATQITTSKHFFDHTAHKYIEENCYDLGLRFIRGLSADMDDLLKEEGQKDALAFFNYVRYCIEKGIYETAPVLRSVTADNYIPSLPQIPKKETFDTVILTNCEPEDQRLASMIQDFQRAYPYKTRLINIAEYPFSGGCLGCFRCAGDGKCTYKDGFDTFLREKIQTADAIVYAFTIKDHSMGASFKCYDDRQFCNGHRTVTMGMPMGYIINGDYQQEYNLQTILLARCEVGYNFFCGAGYNTEEIKGMIGRLTYALENKYVQPQNFYGVGGMKIFRDLIYLMQGFMREDHRFYKKHGIYDFPQKKIGTLWKMKLVGIVVTNPKLMNKMGNKLNEGMIAPYKKVIDSL